MKGGYHALAGGKGTSLSFSFSKSDITDATAKLPGRLEKR
jgi:hypothetical protein